MVLPAGFPPASFRLEDGCLMYSTTAAIRNWSEWQDFHLRPPGPKPGALKTELHSEKMADPKNHPQPSRRQRDALLIELRVQNGLPRRSSKYGRVSPPTRCASARAAF